MTASQIVSSIKRVNERLAEIVRQAARGLIPQSAADNFRAALQTAAGDYLTKSGNISHGKKAVENIDEDALKRLEQRATAGEIKERTREGARIEYGSEMTEDEYETYIEDIDFVNEAMASDPSEAYDAYNAAFAGTTGRKSYKQLRAAIEAYTGTDTKPSRFSVENIFR